MLRKREKKFYPRIPFILDPGTKIPKKIAKKIDKIKKPLSNIISSQNGMRLIEKGRKKFQSRIPFILDPGKKITKKIAKKFQKMKKLNSGIISIQKGLREAKKEKKNLVLNSVPTRAGQENFEKDSKKIQKIKNQIGRAHV